MVNADLRLVCDFWVGWGRGVQPVPLVSLHRSNLSACPVLSTRPRHNEHVCPAVCKRRESRARVSPFPLLYNLTPPSLTRGGGSGSGVQ